MSYQILFQDSGPKAALLSADQCGALFRPPLDAAAFKHWAGIHNCPPDGAITTAGGLEPAWVRSHVRLRRASVRVSTTRRMQRQAARQ